MPRRKWGKTRKKVNPLAIGWAIIYVIINNTKVRMAAHNFGFLKTTPRPQLLKFQENPLLFWVHKQKLS